MWEFRTGTRTVHTSVLPPLSFARSQTTNGTCLPSRVAVRKPVHHVTNCCNHANAPPCTGTQPTHIHFSAAKPGPADISTGHPSDTRSLQSIDPRLYSASTATPVTVSGPNGLRPGFVYDILTLPNQYGRPGFLIGSPAPAQAVVPPCTLATSE